MPSSQRSGRDTDNLLTRGPRQQARHIADDCACKPAKQLRCKTQLSPPAATVPGLQSGLRLSAGGVTRCRLAGNFLTLEEAVREYSADAMRIAMADAGDTMDDANFDYKVANSAILRLTKELAWVEEVLAALPGMRTGQALFADKAFSNEMNRAVHSTREVSRACSAPYPHFGLIFLLP